MTAAANASAVRLGNLSTVLTWQRLFLEREEIVMARARAVTVPSKRPLSSVTGAPVGGYEGMTIRSLAAGLGVALVTLHRHVENKDDLLDEVADRLPGESWKPRTERQLSAFTTPRQFADGLGRLLRLGSVSLVKAARESWPEATLARCRQDRGTARPAGAERRTESGRFAGLSRRPSPRHPPRPRPARRPRRGRHPSPPPGARHGARTCGPAATTRRRPRR